MQGWHLAANKVLLPSRLNRQSSRLNVAPLDEQLPRGCLGAAFAEADEAFLTTDEDLAFTEGGRGEDFFGEIAFG